MAHLTEHEAWTAERRRIEHRRAIRDGSVDNRTDAERRSDSLMLWVIAPAAIAFTLLAAFGLGLVR